MIASHLPLGGVGADRVDPLAQRDKPQAAEAIRQVAADFESIFLAMMLKELRKTAGEGGLFGRDSSDVYGGLFDMFMSQHLADSGGLGIGKAIEAYLENGDQ